MRRQRFISASVVTAVCALSASHADPIEEVITTAPWWVYSCLDLYSPQQCERMFWEWYQNQYDQSGLGDMGGGGGGVGPRPNEHCNVPAVDDQKAKDKITQYEGDDPKTRAQTLQFYGVAYDNQTGYVPPDGPNQPSATSGITFRGVDLGRHYRSEFVQMGVPSSILDKFPDRWFVVDELQNVYEPTPWGGIVTRVVSVPNTFFARGNPAQVEIEMATNRGTRNVLTQAESEQLFNLKYERVRFVISKWMRDDLDYKFEQLPSGTQAALINQKFHRGSLDDNIKAALKDKNWTTLVAKLGAQQDPRSRDNAAAVQSDIDSGALHAKQVPC